MKKYILLFLSAGLIIAACTRKSAPASSSIAKVTYTAGVMPILQNSCTPCHYPSQGGKVTSFEGYDAVKSNIDQMITRVQLDPSNPKFMPFRSKKPPLTPAQID